MAENTESLSRLQTFYGHLDALPLLQVMINDEFKDQIALVSSFGAGSALLLSLVAEVNPATPVIFLETGKHFPETLTYLEQIEKHLGLTNIIQARPDPVLLKNTDAEGGLWKTNPNRCCWLRKVEPLQRALDQGGYRALITGRKRYQTPQRAEMENVELHEDGRFRVNPLARWSRDTVQAEFERRQLPEHPLIAKGYLSIGCEPCTRPVQPGEDERAGRWAHTADLPGGEKKIECGIHVGGDESMSAPVKPDWDI
jgi:phosphoadenosine phosphosulfate reductase